MGTPTTGTVATKSVACTEQLERLPAPLGGALGKGIRPRSGAPPVSRRAPAPPPLPSPVGPAAREEGGAEEPAIDCLFHKVKLHGLQGLSLVRACMALLRAYSAPSMLTFRQRSSCLPVGRQSSSAPPLAPSASVRCPCGLRQRASRRPACRRAARLRQTPVARIWRGIEGRGRGWDIGRKLFASASRAGTAGSNWEGERAAGERHRHRRPSPADRLWRRLLQALLNA